MKTNTQLIRIRMICLCTALLSVASASATSNYRYGPDEYVTIANGISPNGKYAITAHGAGDLGYDRFHIFVTDATTGRKVGPLEEIAQTLDTGAGAFCAKWSQDSQDVAITYRVDRHAPLKSVSYKISNGRAQALKMPHDTTDPEVVSYWQQQCSQSKPSPKIFGAQSATSASSLAVTNSSAPSPESLITPGAERFVVGGLSVGATPLQVIRFLSAKGLHPTGERQWSYAQGAKTVQKVNYVAKESYSNGKTGLDEVKAELSFTPPFPTSNGVFSLVHDIWYETHYGEGVSVTQIKTDLQNRYGSTKDSSDGFPCPFLRWGIRGKSYASVDVNVQAFICPAPNPGAVGTLRISILDNGLLGEAMTRARAHLDQVDSERNKDTTKPSY